MLTLVAALAAGAVASAQRTPPPAGTPAPASRPGVLGEGVTLLPNGWRIAPAGRAVQVGDFPMSMVRSADGRYVIISNNGWSKPSLTVVDTRQYAVRSRVAVDHAWLGLVWHPDGRRLYSSGAAENTVNEFTWEKAELKAADKFVLGQARHLAAARDARPRRHRVHRRARHLGRRCSAVCGPHPGPRVEPRRPDEEPRQPHRRPPRRTLHAVALARRRARCSCRCGAARRSWRSTPQRWPSRPRSRSANIPMRWRCRAMARGSSSRAPTPTRCGQSTCRAW